MLPDVNGRTMRRGKLFAALSEPRRVDPFATKSRNLRTSKTIIRTCVRTPSARTAPSGARVDALLRDLARRAGQSHHDPRGPLVVQLLRRVGRLVIVRVAERGRVRDHHAGVARLPEAP